MLIIIKWNANNNKKLGEREKMSVKKFQSQIMYKRYNQAVNN